MPQHTESAQPRNVRDSLFRWFSIPIVLTWDSSISDDFLWAGTTTVLVPLGNEVVVSQQSDVCTLRACCTQREILILHVDTPLFNLALKQREPRQKTSKQRWQRTFRGYTTTTVGRHKQLWNEHMLRCTYNLSQKSQPATHFVVCFS